MCIIQVTGPVNILLKTFKNLEKTGFSEDTAFLSQFIDKYVYENRKKTFFFIGLLHLEILQI